MYYLNELPAEIEIIQPNHRDTFMFVATCYTFQSILAPNLASRVASTSIHLIWHSNVRSNLFIETKLWRSFVDRCFLFVLLVPCVYVCEVAGEAKKKRERTRKWKKSITSPLPFPQVNQKKKKTAKKNRLGTLQRKEEKRRKRKESLYIVRCSPVSFSSVEFCERRVSLNSIFF